jgi:hypothetical protein
VTGTVADSADLVATLSKVITRTYSIDLVSGTTSETELDRAILAAMKKRAKNGAKVEPLPNWTLHDLRRTAKTTLTRSSPPSSPSVGVVEDAIGGPPSPTVSVGATSLTAVGQPSSRRRGRRRRHHEALTVSYEAARPEKTICGRCARYATLAAAIASPTRVRLHPGRGMTSGRLVPCPSGKECRAARLSAG